MAQAIIYDGFFVGSTTVKVRVPGVTPGTTIYLYDEDSLVLLGSQSTAIDDVEIAVSPLASNRIIAFTGSFGNGTAGGVAVMETDKYFTGWLIPEPVDAESVPEEIGLYNPGALHPVTARYDATLVNSIPAAYRAAAILLAAEPIVFDVKITYRVDSGSGDNVAIVEVTSVRNARGIYSTVIDGTTGMTKNIFDDKTFNIVVTDSESRSVTRSFTVNPVTGYMPVPPTPPASSIVMYMVSSFLAGGSGTGYIIRVDARSPDPLEVSYDGGTTYENLIHNGTQNGGFKDGFAPGSRVVVIRVISDPGDFVSVTIPVPYP